MAVIGIIVTIGLGVFFYVLRSRLQLLYGLIELIVAVAIIFLTFYPQTNYLLVQDASVWGWFLSNGVGMLAGIYVMVRGLDNIEKGLPPNWGAAWINSLTGGPK